MPKRRTQDERSAETRAKLIDAAIEAIGARGLQNATNSEISRRAGVSRGALQHHFRSKSDLMVAVIEYICRRFASGVADVADRSRPLAARCDDLVETLWSIYGSPAYAAAIEVLLGARSDPETFERIRDYRMLSVEVAERHWANALSDVAVDPERLADILHFTVAAMRGFSLHAAVRSDARFYRRQFRLLSDSLLAALRSDAVEDDRDDAAVPSVGNTNAINEMGRRLP